MGTSGIALTFVFLFSLLIIVSSLKHSYRANSKKKRPPGPWAIPLLGSIHHMVTSQPQAALRDLAEKHGPVMYLRLGQVDTVVVSSPSAAQEVLQDNDFCFASRPTLVIPEIMAYGKLGLGFTPYGDYWRAMRKLCSIALLSARKVRQFAPIRDSETMALVGDIRAAAAAGGKGNAVDISRLLVSCTYSITCLATFGDCCRRERIEQFISVVAVVVSQSLGFCVSDLFPSLWFLNGLTRTRRQLWRAHRQLDEWFSKIIEECEARWKESNAKTGGEDEAEAEDNLLEIMLRARDEEELPFAFNNTNIKAIMVDLFFGGTETVSTVAEWVMSELMRHPTEMAKAQAEVREAFNNILPRHHESHLDKLQYTRMVIKETLRLHPTIPLLPRLCGKTCDVGGFEVTKGSRVMINAWAMARSPEYWDDPEEFRPTRFENNKADYKGTDFSYLPFSSGRRMCAGIGFSMATVDLIVARLLYYFDWSLPGKMLPEDLNMETVFGATAKRREQLQLVATPYDVPVYI